MSDSIESILDILVKECALYKDLHEVSRKKSEIIVDGDIAGLSNVLTIEQQLIVELGHLESQREELIEAWSKAKGLAPNSVTLAQIIMCLEDDLRKRMEDVRRDLGEMISRQKLVNDLNESLIRNNLEYIDFSVKLFAGQEESGIVYSKGGKTAAKSQNRNLFDKRV